MTAAQTKQRLFEGSIKEPGMTKLHPQMAMPTCEINNLVLILSGRSYGHHYGQDFNFGAPLFVPPGRIAGKDYKPSRVATRIPQERDLVAADGDVGFADVPSDSKKYFQDMFSSMETETFSKNFSDMVGSWEPLDCVGEDNKSTIFNDSPLIAEESQVAESDLDHCMEAHDVVQTDCEFPVHQMHEVIDLVVAELSQTLLWAKVPADIQADAVTQLKANYEKSECHSYTGAAVRQLMEHTGRKCGEVAMSWHERI